MQQSLQIPTKDNHLVYGILDSRNVDISTTRLLIFVHGLSGNPYEHHYYNAVPYFTSRGFDTFRIDLYSGEEKSRQLVDSSLSTHVADLRVTIEHFKDKYKEIILIGHSLGCLVILDSDLSDISKIILWDPTAGYSDLEEQGGHFEPKLGKYIVDWGMNILLNQEMIDDWKSGADIEKWIAKITKPAKFIFAGGYNKYEAWKPHLERIKDKVQVVVIEGADHGFYKPEKEKELFEETLRGVEV